PAGERAGADETNPACRRRRRSHRVRRAGCARAWSHRPRAFGAKAGVGTNPSSSPINPLGFGLGGRGGASFFGFYGGVDLMYYFGGSQSVLGQNVSLNTLME